MWRSIGCGVVLSFGVSATAQVLPSQALTNHALINQSQTDNALISPVDRLYHSFLHDATVYQKTDDVLKRRGYRVADIQVLKDEKSLRMQVIAERSNQNYAIIIDYPSFKIISEKRL